MKSPKLDTNKNPHAVALGRLGGLAANRRKLTAADVRDIRASKLTYAVLAARFNVTPVTICNIKTGRTWRWLPSAETEAQ